MKDTSQKDISQSVRVLKRIIRDTEDLVSTIQDQEARAALVGTMRTLADPIGDPAAGDPRLAREPPAGGRGQGVEPGGRAAARVGRRRGQGHDAWPGRGARPAGAARHRAGPAGMSRKPRPLPLFHGGIAGLLVGGIVRPAPPHVADGCP